MLYGLKDLVHVFAVIFETKEPDLDDNADMRPWIFNYFISYATLCQSGFSVSANIKQSNSGNKVFVFHVKLTSTFSSYLQSSPPPPETLLDFVKETKLFMSKEVVIMFFFVFSFFVV